MFFRGRQQQASIWRRFRSNTDGFAFAKVDGDATGVEHYRAHIVANSERAVDLLYALSEQLPPTVDVVLEDLRSGRVWKGESIALPDVREAVAHLKVVLAQYGGVEIALFTPEDQLTLNPYLELFVYARTDRWVYLLEGLGLEQLPMVHPKSWKATDKHFPAAPDLVRAVSTAAERLGLGPG
jgi:hypothetical protein